MSEFSQEFERWKKDQMLRKKLRTLESTVTELTEKLESLSNPQPDEPPTNPQPEPEDQPEPLEVETEPEADDPPMGWLERLREPGRKAREARQKAKQERRQNPSRAPKAEPPAKTASKPTKGT